MESLLLVLVVFFPVIAAVIWVTFNIQKPAREQAERFFDGKNPKWVELRSMKDQGFGPFAK